MNEPKRKKTVAMNAFALLLGITFTNWFYMEFLFQRVSRSPIMQDAGLPQGQSDSVMFMIEKMSMLTYFFNPITTGIKILFVALIIQLVFLLRQKEIPYRDLLNICLLAEFIPLSQKFFAFIRLLTIPVQNYTNKLVQQSFLSIQAFLDPLSYTLQSWALMGRISLFTLLWIAFVAYRLNKSGKSSLSDAALILLGLWAISLIFQWGFNLLLPKTPLLN